MLASTFSCLFTFNFLHIRVPLILQDSKPNGILFKKAFPDLLTGSNLFIYLVDCHSPLLYFFFHFTVLLSIIVMYLFTQLECKSLQGKDYIGLIFAFSSQVSIQCLAHNENVIKMLFECLGCEFYLIIIAAFHWVLPQCQVLWGGLYIYCLIKSSRLDVVLTSLSTFKRRTSSHR